MTLTNSAGDLFAFWKPFIIDRPGGTPYAAGELYSTSFDEAPLTEFFGPNLTDAVSYTHLTLPTTERV